jgi:hypothetical protein
MAIKNLENIPKNQNQFEPKMILAVRSTSSGKKKKKHLGQTTFRKWNPFTQK